MRRAFELARLGFGMVSPNPMVGCVIVHNGHVIGEGWHRIFGGPHAEVHAVHSVKDRKLLRESTVYVTLEPCAHYGKTPPCAVLLAEQRVKRVVICNTDPNPLVAGKGMTIMKRAGITVEQGLLEDEGYELNRRFFSFFQKKRPYVILKWAETSDGYIARENYDSKWISNEISRKLVHKWRAEEDAILVGKNTAKTDDPALTVRDWTGKNPLRLVIDPRLELSPSLRLFDGEAATVCYNLKESRQSEKVDFIRCRADHFLEDIMVDLYRREIQSVMIEGGAATLDHFFQAGLWDEARRFQAPSTFGGGITAPAIRHADLVSSTSFTGDELTVFRKKDNG